MLYTPIIDGRIAWCFKEYDPNNREEFPLPIEFIQAGEHFTQKNPGRVFSVMEIY
jgi:hypothetical protein